MSDGKRSAARSKADAAWAKRLDRWRAGEIELTDEENERFQAEHADMALITRYMDPDQRPALRAEVEERASTNLPFRRDLQFIEDAFAQIRSGVHDELLFQLDEKEKARRRGRRLLIAFAVVIGGVLTAVEINRVAQARERSREQAVDRAVTADFDQARTVVSPRRDTTLTFELADVAVRGGSTLTFPDKVRHDGGAGIMALDGEAAFHPWAAGIIARTTTAAVHMVAGRYAVRSLPHTGVTLVTVDSGLAWIEQLGSDMNAGADHRILGVVRAGGRATVTRDGVVKLVASDVGFPITTFAAPAGSSSLSTRPEQIKTRKAYALVESAVRARHGLLR